MRLALLFHDAGYNEDHRTKGFATKEEYSAFLASEALQQLHTSPDTIKRVCAAIISTHRDATFPTIKAKVVRAADLAGLTSDYTVFLENNKRLKQEAEEMQGRLIQWDEWKAITAKVVEFYLKQDIRLTSGYADQKGNSIFHTRARANLKRFLKEEL